MISNGCAGEREGIKSDTAREKPTNGGEKGPKNEWRKEEKKKRSKNAGKQRRQRQSESLGEARVEKRELRREREERVEEMKGPGRIIKSIKRIKNSHGNRTLREKR